MKRPALLTLCTILSLLVGGCASPPTAPAATTMPSVTEATLPSAAPRASPVLPSTWTPAPTASLLATPTARPVSSSTPSPPPAAFRWNPAELPPITLTPTPADAVPTSASRALTAAQSAYAVGDLADALRYLEQALLQVPEHADALALKGQILVEQGYPLSGEQELRRALGIDPFVAAARRGLAQLYAGYGRWRDAAAEYERYLTLIPNDAASWYQLGQIRERQGQVAAAIGAYSETVALEPAHVDALTRRAALWYETEDYAAARSDYSALIDLAPTADLYRRRGEINLLLGEPLLAAADLAAELSLLPAGTPTYTLMLQLGQAYYLGGAPLQAAAAFSRVVVLTDTLAPRLWLGESLLAAEVYTDALRTFSDTLALATADEMWPTLAGRGRSYLGLAQYQPGLEDLTQAWDYAVTVEEQAITLEGQSQAYAGLGDYPEAIARLTAAAELSPLPTLSYYLGIWYQALGDAEEAISNLTVFLEVAQASEVRSELVQDAQTRLAELTAGAP